MIGLLAGLPVGRGSIDNVDRVQAVNFVAQEIMTARQSHCGRRAYDARRDGFRNLPNRCSRCFRATYHGDDGRAPADMYKITRAVGRTRCARTCARSRREIVSRKKCRSNRPMARPSMWIGPRAETTMENLA